jgi:hypothetical protein
VSKVIRQDSAGSRQQAGKTGELDQKAGGMSNRREFTAEEEKRIHRRERREHREKHREKNQRE